MEVLGCNRAARVVQKGDFGYEPFSPLFFNERKKMSCYKPVAAFQSLEANSEGKRPVFWHRPDCDYKCVQIPCGKCDGCKLDMARMWAARCVHESQLHDDNCVITLTYNDEFLPRDGNLVKQHFQDFMKRLRFRISPLLYASCEKSEFNRLRVTKCFKSGVVRYFECGEYGELGGRPHFHACLFGYDFPDKILYKNDNGTRLYRSAILDDCWPFGYSAVGDLNTASASYIARYVVKKIVSDGVDGKVKEFTSMSRNPGIGYNWLVNFASDVYPDDFVIMPGGMKVKPPRYYDDKYMLTNEDVMVQLKSERVKAAKASITNTRYHLKARARIQEAKMKLFSKRGL